jgi:D-alanyl-D-alanine carboxypeptidase
MRALAIVLAGLALAPLAGQPRRAPLDPAAITPAVDAAVQQAMARRRIPGVAVAVVDDGAVVVQRSYGFANLETDTPMAVDAIFEIASLTKQFTAAAIMLLVEDGKLRLDDLLSAHVESVPPAWQRITIRHLLTHTSGLDISAIPRVDGVASLNISRKAALDFIRQQPLFSAPGQTGWYSDAGYVVLGSVIEAISGVSYRQFITDRVFTPLGMTDSSLRDKTRVLKRRVSMYSERNGETVNWSRDSDYELASAFGIHSTLQDLAKWDASLRRSTLLKPASLQQVWTPATLDNGRHARVFGYRYGFGWELADVRGHPTVGHGGASGTYMLRLVDDPLTIIVLTNLETADRHPRALARAIAGAIRPQYRPPEALSPQTDPEPALTTAIQAFVADVSMRRVSPMMSDLYAAWYNDAIGARAVMARQLANAGPLKYLAHEDLAGRSLWGSEPLWRQVHYATEAGGRTYVVSAGLTSDRKVAEFDVQVR